MRRPDAAIDDTEDFAELPAEAEPLLELIAEAAARGKAELRPGLRLGDLGVDSFGALRLRRAVERHTGVRLPLPAFLGDRTVGALLLDWTAARGRGDRAARPGTAAPPPEDSPDTGAAPLTAVQAAYWAGRGEDFPLGGVATFWYHEYDRDPGQRSAPDQEDDLGRLEAAWNRLVRHHPMLRTVIGRDGRQHTLAEPPHYTIGRTDLRGAKDRQVETALADLREQRSHQVRPAQEWPLFDLHAVLLPDGRTRLLVGFDVLVIDFASWRLLMRQWGELLTDPEAELPTAETDFTDIVRRRQTDPAELARHARDRAYWRERLGTLPDGPALPRTTAPETIRGARFTRHRRCLRAAEWRELRERAARQGVSPTSVLLAAFSLVLARWGATEPFAVNTTLYDRPEDVAGVEHLVGDFTTTALVRVTPPDPLAWSGFADHARKVNHTLWEAIEHRSFSGVEVMRELSAAAGAETAGAETVRHPVVFTSGLGVGTDEPPARALGTEVFGVSQTPQVLMDHLVWQENGDLRLCWDTVDAAFPAGFADGLAEAQQRLLRLLAKDDRAWHSVELGWDPAFIEPERLDRAPYGDCGPLLDDPLRRAAQDLPGNPAVLAPGTGWTHGELAERSERLAGRLAAEGAGPGELVLVALPKSPAQIAAVLAVARTGAGYVPVDPAWPAARIEAVCSRARVRLALTAADGSAQLPPGVSPLAVDADGRTDTGPTAAVRGDARPDQLAYAIFTSGSTGTPKGVAIEHRAARTTLDDITDRFAVTADDRVLALSALSFDLSVYDVFGLLGAGGALVLPDTARQRDPEHWCELIGEHRVTVWNTAPALLEMLVEYAEADPGEASRRLASLRLVMLSGDWIPVTLPDRLRALAPGARVMSLGGATEASIWSITYPIGEVDPDWPSIPYGRPLRGQFFHVLDTDGRPCPVGADGELFIAGDGLARGYLGDEAQTAERFAVHPVLGERLYRTGDLGRRRPDGQIEFLGRTDRQVKVRGHRIELGEIDAALSRLPGIRQAVSAAVPGPDGRPRLVAYIALTAPAEATSPTDRELTRALAERLPDYMLPGRYVRLDALPVSDNGKVDHRRLPDPFRSPRREEPPAEPSPALPQAVVPGPRPAADDATPKTSAVPAGPAAEGEPAGGADRGALEAVLREILGPQADFGTGLLAAGATSLDVVRLANAIEDHGAERPSFQRLAAFDSLTDLLDAYAAPPAPGTAYDAPAQAAAGEPHHPAPAHLPLPPAPEGLDLTVRLEPSRGQDPADALEAAARWLRELRRRTGEHGRTLHDVRVGADGALLTVGVTGHAASGTDAVPGVVPDAGAPAPLPGPLPSTFPLTEMQLAYLVGRADTWLGNAVGPHYYTEADLDDLDIDRLRAALHTVVRRHPMLRAVVTDDTRQTVLPEPPLPEIDVYDLRGLAPDAARQELSRLRHERSHRVLDPTRSPMLHLAATRTEERGWRLHFGLDLLFCDARSAVALVDDLLTAYRDPGALPPPPSAAFAEWAHECSAAADGRRRAEATRYWQRRAAELPDGPALPITPPGPDGVRFTRRRTVLGAERWSTLRDLARRHRVTPTAVLLTAFADVLRAGTGSDRFTLVLTTFDRPERHEGVIGDYTSTVLLGVEDPAPDIAGRVRRTQDRLWSDLEHASGPAGVHGNEVLREMTARRGRQVLLPVVFSSGLGSTSGARGSTDASELLDGFGRTVYAVSQTPHVVLDCQVFEQNGELRVNWDAVEAAFPPGYLDALFTAYTDLLSLLTGGRSAWRSADPAALADRSLRPAEPVRGRVPLTVRTAGDDGRDLATELRVATALAGLIGADPEHLDRDRSFFELGATSLTLVRAHRALRKELDGTLSVLDLFAHPSIRALAARIGRGGEAAFPRTDAGERRAGDRSAPLADPLIARARRRGGQRRDRRRAGR
ncbi:amino acid adenylation domain-containing protein [Streptomyces nanhaiensis]|uniref:amino acid adenylation domain-containing protein n=1 Tax=Streptomyces nanhaiensis TaxID=679319 RepID=UPI00399D0B98